MKIIAIFFYLFSINANALDKPYELPIYVFEVKPLIYQDDNKKIFGIWYEGFEKLSALSGIKFKYLFTSIPRLELLLGGTHPGCNLTLLKTPKRVQKGNINFITEHAVKTIFKVYQRSDDNRNWTIKDLENNPNVKIASNTSVAIEALAEKNIKAEQLFNINSITNMLTYRRIDIFVGSNLAVEKLAEFQDGRIKAGLEIKTLTHGIGCSKATPDAIVKRLQNASKSWVLPH